MGFCRITEATAAIFKEGERKLVFSNRRRRCIAKQSDSCATPATAGGRDNDGRGPLEKSNQASSPISPANDLLPEEVGEAAK